MAHWKVLTNDPWPPRDELCLPGLVDEMWTTRLLFYRPDPLGYCTIIKDMIRVQEYSKLSVEERQRLKGYMK